MAAGLADDLATTVLLATDKPVMIAPTMNVEMWNHRATQRNVAQLEADGVIRIGPIAGDLACGETGSGRMSEPDDLAAAVETYFATRAGADASSTAASLQGRRILVTAGPTHEAIDPVRYLANRSSGKQGYALAVALAHLGAETMLISGPTELPDPPGVAVVRVQSACEMLQATQACLPVDAAVFVAAVADWRVAGEAEQKIKKDGNGPPVLELVENPDILSHIAGLKTGRPALVVGFAAETEKIISHAQAKRKRKGCDWIVANDVSLNGAGDGGGVVGGVMGGDRNLVHLVKDDSVDSWPELDKTEVARRLAARIADHLKQQAKS